MPLPPSAPVELLPDPDRAARTLLARRPDPQLAQALAALLDAEGEHPFDAFVVSVTARLAAPRAELSAAVAALAAAPTDDASAPFVSRVVAAGQRLTRLTTRLTEYAAACADVADPADLDLAAAVAAARTDLAELGQAGPAEVSVTGPPLPLDAVLLGSAMRHLLGNAALYAVDAPVSISGSREGVRWELVVSDSGPGIAAADRRRVLQPLVRLDRDRAVPGDGLGLAICARVARAHGGTIFVNRADGGGTSVRLVSALR